MLPLKKKDNTDLSLEKGLIVGQSEHKFIVRTEFGLVQAERSADCLLIPEIRDRVLLLWIDENEVYILNVLKRGASSARAVLSFSGDAAIDVSGALDLNADRITASSRQDMEIEADNIGVSCHTGKADFNELSFKGDSITGKTRIYKLAADFIENRAETAMQHFKRLYRRIDEFEDSLIGRASLRIKQQFSINSKSVSIRSKDRVKVDADKILLG